MEWLVDWWQVLVAIICFLIFIICHITKINIIEFLKYAVSVAESDLGSGTGQLKLRRAYDIAIAKFPIIKIIPFSTFSKWVDIALEWMKNQLETNASINLLVQEGDLK